MKKYIVIVLLTIVVAGCWYWFVVQASTKPPVPVITIGQQQLEVARGSYCWSSFLTSECVDTISPPELLEHEGISPTVVSPASEIQITFKREPKKESVGVNVWLDGGDAESVALTNNTFIAPKEKGIYIYDVFARWDKGDASYAFVIEVQ